jgi:aminoglycoside phosphotransferase (APT) family kinase protein
VRINDENDETTERAEVPASLLAAWGLDTTRAAAFELRTGHIHRSYRVDRDGTPRFLLQRINHHVFRRPVELMENVALVTRHLRKRRTERGDVEIARRSLELVPTALGRDYHRDGDGFVWRAFRWIGGAETHEVAGPGHAEAAAAAYGDFQLLLADLPPERLHVTIPRFHDTAHRFVQLDEAAREDRAGRRSSSAPELDALQARRELALRLDASALPPRVVHNDTKLSNVLFARGSSEALCVVDLDTVMPGLCAHDFGDMVRSIGNIAPEDSPGGAGASIDPELFSALARGYLRSTSGWLTASERDTLVDGAFAIVAEMAARFLADHLAGDVYFRVTRPDHNLDRARTQIALLESLLAREGELRAIVSSCSAALRS